MGFPENVLTSDEKVASNLHPHWREVVPATIVGLILIAAAIYLSWVTPDDSTGNWIQWVVVAIAVVVGVFLVIIPFLRWRTTRYVITSHRVMLRHGIVNKSGKDITLSKITDVSFSQNLLDRILGSGTLSIESAGDSPNEEFHGIPRSDRVQQLINRLIDEDANRRAKSMVVRAGLDSQEGIGEHETAPENEGGPEAVSEGGSHPEPEAEPEAESVAESVAGSGTGLTSGSTQREQGDEGSGAPR